MYVCLCRSVTESEVRRVGRAGSTTAEALIARLGLDHPRCCGRCRQNIDQFVRLATSYEPDSAQAASAVPAPA